MRTQVGQYEPQPRSRAQPVVNKHAALAGMRMASHRFSRLLSRRSIPLAATASSTEKGQATTGLDECKLASGEVIHAADDVRP